VLPFLNRFHRKQRGVPLSGKLDPILEKMMIESKPINRKDSGNQGVIRVSGIKNNSPEKQRKSFSF
jgi:hypothetical protein